MATDTGRTRTAICLMYRLIQAGRFRRVLFLVDRSALGNQTDDALGDIRLEQHKTFKEIHDVKVLKDIEPERDTRFQTTGGTQLMLDAQL